MSLLSGVGSAEWILNSAFRFLFISGLAVFGLRLLRRSTAPLRSMLSLLTLLAICLLALPPFTGMGSPVFSFPSGTLNVMSGTGGGFVPAEPGGPLPGLPAGNSPPEVFESSPGNKTDFQTFIPSFMVRALNLFGLIWGMGFAFCLLRILMGVVSIRKIRKEALPVHDVRLLRLFRSAAEVIGRPARVGLLQSTRVQGPQVFGILNPVILLPYDFCKGLSDSDIRGIFLHELSHLRHRDTVVGLFQRLVAASNWWNPLVRRISCELSRAREEISDAHVLLRGDSREYARCLIRLAERLGCREEIPASSCLVPHHLPLTERVQKILSKESTMDTMLKKPARALAVIAVIICMIPAASLRLTFAASGAEAAGQEVEVIWNEPEETSEAAPKLIEKLNPIYPAEALKAGIQGKIELHGRTNIEGCVMQVEIIKAENDFLKAAAVQSILGWKFEPLKEKGASEGTSLSAAFDFKLADGRPSISVEYRVGINFGIPVRIGNPVRPLRRLKTVTPLYPETALQAKVEGVVILEVTTDVYGRVVNVKTLRSVPLLDQAAVEAVRQWIFEPLVVNGRPRSTVFTVSVPFRLDDARKRGGVQGGVVGGVAGGVEGGVTGGVKAGTASGVEGGVEGGVRGGIVSRDEIKTRGNIEVFPAGDAKILLSSGGNAAPPKLIRLIYPIYPEIARQSKVEGSVILEVTTDVYGRVVNVKTLRSVPLLDKASVEAVKQWIFEPTVIEGTPQSVKLIITITFSNQT